MSVGTRTISRHDGRSSRLAPLFLSIGPQLLNFSTLRGDGFFQLLNTCNVYP
jgi:hypothetical protein